MRGKAYLRRLPMKVRFTLASLLTRNRKVSSTINRDDCSCNNRRLHECYYKTTEFDGLHYAPNHRPIGFDTAEFFTVIIRHISPHIRGDEAGRTTLHLIGAKETAAT